MAKAGKKKVRQKRTVSTLKKSSAKAKMNKVGRY